jgi:rfaE bifunctional protein nucleotidyltransferase chain/domain
MNFISPIREELELIEKGNYQNRANSKKQNYLNKLFKKPWGHEYLTYQTNKIGIWILHVIQNHKTSLHCHFKKDTILFVLSGTFRIDLFNSYRILNECEMLYIPANTFHGIGSYVSEGIIMEIEIYSENIQYSDKNDLLRIRDIYNRDKNTYETSVEEINVDTSSSIQFHINNTFTFGNTTIHITNKPEPSQFMFLLDGIFFKNNSIAGPGSLFSQSDTISLLSNEMTIMSITNNYFLQNKKIIHSKEHLIDFLNHYPNKETIGLTSGCFDILHSGHIDNLKQCKQLCDTFFVCLSSDKQIGELKGKNRPINNIIDRTNMLIHLSFIDYIILYDEINNELETELDNIMEIIKPFYWFKGSDYNEEQIRFKHPSLKNIHLIENIPNKSTTNIIQKIIDKTI